MSEIGRALREEPEPRRRSRSLMRGFRVWVTSLTVIAVITFGTWIGSLLWLDALGESLHGQTEKAMFTSGVLRAELVSQEVAAQIYARTRDEAALRRYQAALRAAQTSLAELHGLVASGAMSAENSARLVDLQRSISDWRSRFADRTLSGFSRELTPEEFEQHERLFARVEADAIALESGLLAERDQQAARLADLTAHLRWLGLVIAAVLAGLLVAAGVAMRRQVLTPLSRLAAQVRAVVSGDMQQRVRVPGPEEIAELSEDVDSMRRHILSELDRLQEVARDLERSNRNLEQFAYVASHDLQEPLRKVASACRLLQRRYAGRLDERADRYIDLAVDGAQRMQQLITDLLEFSRVGRTTVELEPVELGTVAQAAAAQLDVLREKTGGTVNLGELPTVRGNPLLLRQLMLNLIGNALKFRREGVPPVVEVTARRASASSWEITVRDNGIGIPAEDAERVFVIFERLHRGAYPGTGIGLAMARRIVEYQGGRIWVDSSAPGQGATLRFTLPAVVERESQPSAERVKVG